MSLLFPLMQSDLQAYVENLLKKIVINPFQELVMWSPTSQYQE